MTKNAKNTTVNENIDGANVSATLDALIASGDFIELRLERTIYKPEATGAAILQGYIVDLLVMPPIKQGKTERPWQALLFRTTAPTKGVDREGNVVDVQADEEVIIPATFQLLQGLSRFSRDSEKMFEAAVLPKDKIDIGGGQSMWTYRVALGKKTMRREGGYVLGGKPEGDVKALPVGNGVVLSQDGRPVASVIGASAVS